MKQGIEVAEDCLFCERLTKRITELEEALRNLIDKLDAVKPEIDKVTMLAWAHGNRYTGPTYEKELRCAREVLDHE